MQDYILVFFVIVKIVVESICYLCIVKIAEGTRDIRRGRY